MNPNQIFSKCHASVAKLTVNQILTLREALDKEILRRARQLPTQKLEDCLTKSEPPAQEVDGKEPDYIITTDGGNGNNVPPYGLGYGSAKYSGSFNAFESFYFGRPMSNNAAEIWTMVRATQKVVANTSGKLKIHFISDSQIALKYAKDAPFGRAKWSNGSSEEMVNAIKELRVLLAGHTVTTEWVPREKIFAIFGH